MRNGAGVKRDILSVTFPCPVVGSGIHFISDVKFRHFSTDLYDDAGRIEPQYLRKFLTVTSPHKPVAYFPIDRVYARRMNFDQNLVRLNRRFWNIANL
jgi:hypothetical protein